MRYYSYQYKHKISKLIRSLGSTSLSFYLQLSQAAQDVKRASRLERKYGIIPDWHNYKARSYGRTITIPFKTPCGKPVPQNLLIRSIESLDSAERRYSSPAPTEIKIQIIAKLNNKA